jgi:hypothetical protein
MSHTRNLAVRLAAGALVVAAAGCGGARATPGTSGHTMTSTTANGWRTLHGKACPLHPAPLAQLTSAGAGQQPVLPTGAEAAWICLYTHGKPPDARNGGSLNVAKKMTISAVEPALRLIGSLAPHSTKPCTEVGGGLFDALVLVDKKGRAFPVLATPTPAQVPSNCGVASTPNGSLELSSDRLNRLLFHLAGQPFPD